jgi:transposase
MPSALSQSIRRKIVERRQGRESLAQIARDFNISYQTASRIWHRFKAEGRLTPHYERCSHTEIRKSPALYERAVSLKQTHPGWGAGLIRLELASEFGEIGLPSQRTLQRWFRRAGVAVKPSDHRPKPTVQRGQAVHEVWAMDAKEQMLLKDGSYCCWLTITDEKSGAILSVTLFPPTSLDKD